MQLHHFPHLLWTSPMFMPKFVGLLRIICISYAYHMHIICISYACHMYIICISCIYMCQELMQLSSRPRPAWSLQCLDKKKGSKNTRRSHSQPTPATKAREKFGRAGIKTGVVGYGFLGKRNFLGITLLRYNACSRFQRAMPIQHASKLAWISGVCAVYQSVGP